MSFGRACRDTYVYHELVRPPVVCPRYGTSTRVPVRPYPGVTPLDFDHTRFKWLWEQRFTCGCAVRYCIDDPCRYVETIHDCGR
jgi:hypothetical protein